MCIPGRHIKRVTNSTGSLDSDARQTSGIMDSPSEWQESHTKWPFTHSVLLMKLPPQTEHTMLLRFSRYSRGAPHITQPETNPDMTTA